MKDFKYCPFCGSETEFVPFDAGQAAIPEPWCENCKVGFARGMFRAALLRARDRWDCLVGNIDVNGEPLKPRAEWEKI